MHPALLSPVISQYTYLAEEKLVAEVMTSSCPWTTTGIFLQPGDLRIRFSSFIVSWRTFGGHMSILVTTTNTGTLRAKAKPRCSLVIPITPALAPTCVSVIGRDKVYLEYTQTNVKCVHVHVCMPTIEHLLLWLGDKHTYTKVHVVHVFNFLNQL